MPPCLKREPQLSGRALIERLNLSPILHFESAGSSSLATSASAFAIAHTSSASPLLINTSVFHTDERTSLNTSGPCGPFATQDMDAIVVSGAEAMNLALRRVQANIVPPRLPAPNEYTTDFEKLITLYEPILQGLIAFLPTSSIFQLYHTSRYLREHLQSYPLAWRTLSFRLPQPGNNLISAGANAAENAELESKQYALDLVLKRVVVPIAARLTSLDLCNTAISGALLVGSVLEPRKETLQHISVRGCKNVSLKYHIVPYLHQMKIEMRYWGDTRAFALKSLYTYRCRHHRRRPYLPASLIRRDSDSEPTHDLIELCHALGIWTDTAWCPTPGPRCHRRKDYHGTRAAPGTMEVWVPFDRLWRSSNRIGPADEHSRRRPMVGKLWEEIECGHDGEALGTLDSEIFAGEGKHVPTHLRKSHREFVEGVKCDQCEQVILERCETCSIRMHCMGCRKTLCASCAFNRPLQKRRKTRASTGSTDGQSDVSTEASTTNANEKETTELWWAPGAVRSPNIMTDASEDPDSDEEARTPARINGQQQPGPLKIKMYWCCLEPLFSGGGGVAFVGPGLGGHGSERIRAVPLKQAKRYLDPDFCSDNGDQIDVNFQRFEDRISTNIDILPYLQQTNLDLQAKTCPRCLCHACYSSFKWKIECRACKRAICREHDFRALKVRKCGFRDLADEREYVRNPPKLAREEQDESQWPQGLLIPRFNISNTGESSSSDIFLDDDRRARQFDTASQEWSDAGSLGDGPATRDSSSTPRATPSPYADRSSSVASRGPAAEEDEMRPTLFYPNLDLVERANIVARSRPSVRGRSHSMSDVLDGKGKGKIKAALLSQNTSAAKERRLLPCSGNHPVQWKGCGAYFCQGSRSMGDTRQRCFATGKECTECGVFVCQFCMPKSAKCSCSFCENNYHCPHCFNKDEIRRQCLREEEIRAREQKLEQEKKAEEARSKQEREDREQADLILKWGGEFWGALTSTGYVEESALPVAGPSSVIAGPSRSTIPAQAENELPTTDVPFRMLRDVRLENMNTEMRFNMLAGILQGARADDAGEETEEDPEILAIAA